MSCTLLKEAKVVLQQFAKAINLDAKEEVISSLEKSIKLLYDSLLHVMQSVKNSIVVSDAHTNILITNLCNSIDSVLQSPTIGSADQEILHTLQKERSAVIASVILDLSKTFLRLTKEVENLVIQLQGATFAHNDNNNLMFSLAIGKDLVASVKKSFECIKTIYELHELSQERTEDVESSPQSGETLEEEESRSVWDDNPNPDQPTGIFTLNGLVQHLTSPQHYG